MTATITIRIQDDLVSTVIELVARHCVELHLVPDKEEVKPLAATGQKPRVRGVAGRGNDSIGIDEISRRETTMSALYAVERKGFIGATNDDIASAMRDDGFRASSASPAISLLLNKGLLSKTGDRANRLLFLTDSGRDFINSVKSK